LHKWEVFPRQKIAQIRFLTSFGMTNREVRASGRAARRHQHIFSGRPSAKQLTKSVIPNEVRNLSILETNQ